MPPREILARLGTKASPKRVEYGAGIEEDVSGGLLR